jgi:hypothetical protein
MPSSVAVSRTSKPTATNTQILQLKKNRLTGGFYVRYTEPARVQCTLVGAQLVFRALKH